MAIENSTESCRGLVLLAYLLSQSLDRNYVYKCKYTAFIYTGPVISNGMIPIKHMVFICASLTVTR